MQKRFTALVLVLALAAVALVSGASAADPTTQRVQETYAYANFRGVDPATGVRTIISIDGSDTLIDGVASSSANVTVLQIDTATGEPVFDAGGWVELDESAFQAGRLLESASLRASMTGRDASGADVPITVDAEFTGVSRLIHDPSVFILRDPALLGLVRVNFAGRIASAVATVTVGGKRYEAPLYDSMISETTSGELTLGR